MLQHAAAALAERAATSAGMAVFPRAADTPEALHAVADADMYAAKRRRSGAISSLVPGNLMEG